MTTAQRRAGWHKSSYSNQANGCVEIRFDGDSVLVRDSKHRDGSHLAVARAEWQRFVRQTERDNGDSM